MNEEQADFLAYLNATSPPAQARSFLADAGALIVYMSPGINAVMFRRRAEPGGIHYSFSLALLHEAGGILGLMRDWEAVPG